MKKLLSVLIVLVYSLSLYAAVNVTVNGTSHSIPQTGERGWGTNVTTWIQDISADVLYPTGGNFTLGADVNFGATYGLLGAYFSGRSSAASAGLFRLGNAEAVAWRNGADSADLTLDISSNWLQFEGVDLADVSTAQTLTNKTLTAPALDLPTIDIIEIDTESATPATPAAGGKFYVKSDNKPYFLNDAGTETDLSATGSADGNEPSLLQNLGFQIQPAGGGALNIYLKQADGSTDPGTGTGAVKIAFNQPGGSTADYDIESITAAMSITVPSGATLGFADNTEQYVYVYATLFSGTVDLAVSSILLDESQVHTVVALAASNDANALYGGDAGGSRYIRLIGRFRSTQTTAGAWNAGGNPEAITQGMRLIEPHYVESKGSSSVAWATACGAASQHGDLTSVELTPGTWYCDAQFQAYNSGALSLLASVYIGISTTSGNSASGLTIGDNYYQESMPTDSGYLKTYAVTGYRVTVSAADIYYLKCFSTQTTNFNNNGYKLSCRKEH